MISLRSVVKRYETDGSAIIEPVRNVSLEIPPGAFVMIVGRSGCGKTTLLNLIAGLVSPTAGAVVIDGINLRSMSDRSLAQLRSQKIGFVFQFPSLLPSLTATENVALPGRFVSEHSRKANLRAKGLLDMVGLGKRLNAYPRQLSAGEQKRVVIARALMNNPRILLADEPTSDLDEKTEAEIMDMLREINTTGVTTVMATHTLQLIPRATVALRMENGTLVKIAPAGQ